MKKKKGDPTFFHTLRTLVEMYIGDILHLIMVLDNVKTAVAKHKTVKEIKAQLKNDCLKILFCHFLESYKKDISCFPLALFTHTYIYIYIYICI